MVDFTKIEVQEDQASSDIPATLPILPLRHGVLFPVMMLPMEISEERFKRAIEEAAPRERIVGLFTIKEEEKEIDNPEFYQNGTAAMIMRMLRTPTGTLQVILQGRQRISLKEIVQLEPYISANVEILHEKLTSSREFEGLMRTALKQFEEIINQAPNIPQELNFVLNSLNKPEQKIDLIAAHLNLNKEEQLRILETLDIGERLKLLLGFMDRELDILKIGSKIHHEIQESSNKIQREVYLRQQLQAIKKELGETDEQTAALTELREQLDKANLPEEVRKEANRELERMAQIPTTSPEYTVSRNYLDWIISLPWSISTEDNLDLERAQQVLDEDHHDLEKIKERIVDYLAVGKLKQDLKGPILCFVGPPGTGKTSLGKSIARALERKFVRMALGGIRDEAEIRGHRRTYIGALPGRILQSLRRAGSNNPVFMLDEIDKVGADYRGDPSSALLEVLDPEQNNTFTDHYLDLAFDLSKVMFIATANVIDTIPSPLLDRMEVIHLTGYTEVEKLHISKRYLIPKQLEQHGLKDKDVIFDESAISKIIRNYSREAGLRNLERNIATICRKSARKIAGNDKAPIQINEHEIREILGPEYFLYDKTEEKDEVGVVVGMAWTPVGGDILFVEAMAVPGKGQLKLTGRLGEVMRESAEAAMTYVRARADDLGLPKDFLQQWDLHVHIPEGAVPKDGPSAGVTMTTALVSALSQRPARHDLSMTGEITLRGKVLPVGGIRDKVLAAHRSGIRTVILPKENERHLEDIPESVKNEVKFVFVEHMDEVIKAALHKKPSSLRSIAKGKRAKSMEGMKV